MMENGYTKKSSMRLFILYFVYMEVLVFELKIQKKKEKKKKIEPCYIMIIAFLEFPQNCEPL
jgi:hypothetical protein